MDLFGLTRKLIDTPSITGEEAAVGDFLATYLTKLGFNVDRQVVENDRRNLIAVTESSPRIVFSTHLDTVPPFIPSGEDDEKIYGRGACDAKGIIAAQISAAERLREKGSEQIGLLFTVDEEQSSIGARVANEHTVAKQTAYLINGEPTDNMLAEGTKGSLRLRILTQGRAAHSAYPEQGESAIDKLLDILTDIRALHWPQDSLWGETTCNIGVISGGTRPNVIPAFAQAELHVRLATEASPVKQILEQLVGDRGQINYHSENDPVRLHTLNGFDRCVVRFTTDIPYLSQWGTPLLLGPGSIFQAHTDNEYVSKRELNRAVDLYFQLAKSLLAATTPEVEPDSKVASKNV
jgi:acetylornithine deacetylase